MCDSVGTASGGFVSFSSFRCSFPYHLHKHAWSLEPLPGPAVGAGDTESQDETLSLPIRAVERRVSRLRLVFHTWSEWAFWAAEQFERKIEEPKAAGVGVRCDFRLACLTSLGTVVMGCRTQLRPWMECRSVFLWYGGAEWLWCLQGPLC